MHTADELPPTTDATVPGGHVVHTSVPGSSAYVPGAQGKHEKMDGARKRSEAVPVGQGVHPCAPESEKVPGPQSKHTTGEVAAVTFENVP